MQKIFNDIIERLDDLRKIELKFRGGRCSGKTLAIGYVKGIENSILAIKQISEEYNDSWVPCSERLPEKHGHYLVCSKDIIWVAYYYNYTWWGVEKRCRWEDIEAWMPLPEPYKKEVK